MACALLICMLIAAAFVDAFVRFDLGKIIAVFFILAMVAQIVSLGELLRGDLPRRSQPPMPGRVTKSRAGATDRAAENSQLGAT